MSGALAPAFCACVADRSEGAGDECHDVVGGGVAAHDAGCVRALEQVCDMAREVCRDAWAVVRESNSAVAGALFTAAFSAPVVSIARFQVRRPWEARDDRLHRGIEYRVTVGEDESGPR